MKLRLLYLLPFAAVFLPLLSACTEVDDTPETPKLESLTENGEKKWWLTERRLNEKMVALTRCDLYEYVIWKADGGIATSWSDAEACPGAIIGKWAFIEEEKKVRLEYASNILVGGVPVDTILVDTLVIVDLRPSQFLFYKKDADGNRWGYDYQAIPPDFR